MRYLLASIVFLVVAGCREIQPGESAAIAEGPDMAKCAYCGGWIIKMDNKKFRAGLSSEFAKINHPVLIRYQLDERPGYKEVGWIQIHSIRHR